MHRLAPAPREHALVDPRRDLPAHEIRELYPLLLVELEARLAQHLVLEVRWIPDRELRELLDHRPAEAALAARPPAQEIRCPELLDVLGQKGMIVRLERRLAEHMKERDGTGAAPVRAHQGVDFRLSHGATSSSRAVRARGPPRVYRRLACARPVMTRRSVE
ncbi:hypothetical protein BE08_18485 [Sorangium cellulosum]|uniref:Uncharacterized protein n=1 Tax=Sorangium cellulosum TaxID=56 RepID=A0A150PK04_SORCE|nr:hypothetical protein BE08_18485 [Sorangium cellulosum]